MTDIFEDPFGTWRTVFSPIFHNGEVIAVIGIDYSAEYIDEIVRDASLVQYLNGIFWFVILVVVVIFTVHRMLKPLNRMVTVANEIAGGNLSVLLKERSSNDEIGKLGTSIQKNAKSFAEDDL